MKKKISVVQVVQSYKATDGTLFTSLKLAESHQANLDFCQWYESGNQIVDVNYENVPNETVLRWIIENGEYLKKFFDRR